MIKSLTKSVSEPLIRSLTEKMNDNWPILSRARVLVVGMGLIGGSLAAGLVSRRVCKEVLGWDRDEQSLVLAGERNIIDKAAPSLEAGVAEADIVVLAVPVLAMSSMIQLLAGMSLAGKVITDVGSSKKDVVDTARACLDAEVLVGFVPGHPIAGSEKSGVAAARGDLYDAHKVIVTPLPENSVGACRLVREMWERIGTTVLEMEVAHHDDVLARTSHLPHLLAFSLVDTLAGDRDNQEIFRYAAGGFRDFTRIAASDPTMWHDVFVANRDAVLSALHEFQGGLDQMRVAVEQGDSQSMLGIITRAKSAREHFSRILENQSYLKTMSSHSISYAARAGGPVTGTLRVPGDKSISHRSIMLGALASGVTEVSGFLEGEDALATLQAFRDMGVVIEGPHDGKVTIYGVGLNGLQVPPGPLYLGNAGTAMRLMAGLMAAQSFDVTLTGDKSLSGRPMNRVVKPLQQMGAVIETAEGGRPPLVIRGGQKLVGIDYDMPVASAQVKSCLLLAGMYAEGETSVTEPGITRDHTERMLGGLGYQVGSENGCISLVGGGELKAVDRIEVPADISSAAFFLVAASIAPGSNLLLTHVGINPTRTGILDILKLMGADITLENQREVGGEPVADIRVRSAKLKGIRIPQELVPLAIDEFPVLFVAAACAEGETLLEGAEELRVKESDRIQSMADGLNVLGVKAEALPGGMRVPGCTEQTVFGGGVVDSHGDHRIAMAFAVAALRSGGEIHIQDCANVATSFPNFVDLAHSVGLDLNETES